ncbi:MAG: DUF1311 domain-containing protein, partial [Acinetobacter sp.]|nr:DUF1311 domain-containing protein [Acinetobacter sp.]
MVRNDVAAKNTLVPKAWLNYRDAQCNELTGSLTYGALGLASGFAHLDCEINSTTFRLK